MVMRALALFFLFGSCCCINLKPYNETAMGMFLEYDLDGDGFLTRLEVEQNFDKYDTNGDGRESRHEYTEFICAAQPALYQLSHYLYDEYDLDGDHHLEKHDYDALVVKMDLDGDGVVSAAEFIAFWERIFPKYENIGVHGQSGLHGHSACH